jgi:uncharacterized membrane protein YcaP (DUF421 family)
MRVAELIGGASGLEWVAVKAVLLFTVAVIGLRLGERRTLAQLSAFDFAVAVAIGAIIGRGATASDTSFATSAVALVTLLVAHRLVAIGRRHSRVVRLIDHAPRVLAVGGELQERELALAGLTDEDVYALLREHGVGDLGQVGYLLYEPRGSVTVVGAGHEPGPLVRDRIKASGYHRAPRARQPRQLQAAATRGCWRPSRMRDVPARPDREAAPMRIAIAVVAALCAAFCFALGSLIQQSAARQTHARALRFGLLVALARQRRWLGGMAVTVLAFGIQAVALAFGPLALVQPLVATEVLFALMNRLPLMRKGIIGGLSVASGMAIFVTVSPPTGGVSVPELTAWAPALAVITALAGLSASMGLRSRGTARVIWLAVATAVLYALVNAVTKSSVGLLMHRGAGVLATWEPYTLIAAGVLSGLFGQSAFNAGPLSLSLPVIDTVEPVSSVILGAAVFSERLARSPGLLAIQLIGGVIAATGIVVLSRSPVTLAEERRESRATGLRIQSGPAGSGRECPDW